MRLQFLGGTGTVTGSKYLVEHAGRRLLVDCGMFQGVKQLRLRNWQPLPLPAAEIDVVDDMAFVATDLLARGRGDFAWRFVSGWLDATGDHDALRALRFSMVYPALVRARVATLRAGQGQDAARYVRAARQIVEAPDARLLITHGVPGSGKTYLSQGLLEAAGAVRFRSDVERKRLFGPGAYEPAHTRQTTRAFWRWPAWR